MSYFYGLLAEIEQPTIPPFPPAISQVSVTTPQPTISAGLDVGTSVRAAAIAPAPLASANLGQELEAAIAAVTPTPSAAASFAIDVTVQVGAVTPLPIAQVALPIPVSMTVGAIAPAPSVLAALGRPSVTAPPPAVLPPVGALSDMLARLKLVLPRRWFPDTAPGALSGSPVVDGILSGAAAPLSWLYSLLAYVRLQRRLKTATDANLDLISADFFGLSLRRKTGETDAAFRARILARLLQEKNTRRGVYLAVEALTGHPPNIFEPANTGDTGGWGSLGMTTGTGLGYGLAGGWGSLDLPFQAFITAYRPTGGGVAGVQGYGAIPEAPPAGYAPSIGGYGAGAIEYASLPSVRFAVSDADIYAAITDAAPAATIMWTAITDTVPSVALLDVNFILDVSVLN